MFLKEVHIKGGVCVHPCERVCVHAHQDFCSGSNISVVVCTRMMKARTVRIATV